MKTWSTIYLGDEDPIALKLMFHYLYHLDYPHVSQTEHGLRIDGYQSDTVAEDPTGQDDHAGCRSGENMAEEDVHPNGASPPPDTPPPAADEPIPEPEPEPAPEEEPVAIAAEPVPEPAPEEAPAVPDEFAWMRTSSKKKKKGKVRRTTSSLPSWPGPGPAQKFPEEPEPEPEPEPGPTTATQFNYDRWSSSPTPRRSKKPTGPREDLEADRIAIAQYEPYPATEEQPEPPPPVEEPSPNLTTHAKVYALAKKYRVAGLDGLAVRKFEDESLRHCYSGDFVHAIDEVYGSTAGDDRGLRDVVLKRMYDFPLVMEGDEVQDMLKAGSDKHRKQGSNLAYDLLMYAHNKRSWE